MSERYYLWIFRLFWIFIIIASGWAMGDLEHALSMEFRFGLLIFGAGMFTLIELFEIFMREGYDDEEEDDDDEEMFADEEEEKLI